jgi:putative transposase
VLKEAEQGVPVADLCRKHGMTSATSYEWRRKYGGVEVSEARRLREVEDENRRLKKLVADQALDIEMLKAVNARRRPMTGTTAMEGTGQVAKQTRQSAFFARVRVRVEPRFVDHAAHRLRAHLKTFVAPQVIADTPNTMLGVLLPVKDDPRFELAAQMTR